MKIQTYSMILAGLMLLAGCAVGPPSAGVGAAVVPTFLPPRIAAQNFIAVLDAVEPVAEAVCRKANPLINCDFQLAIDRRRGLPPNAFQTVDDQGRPIIAFTLSLIAGAQNRDELAFIMGHEAGHHIAGHLARQQESALQGAVRAGVLATLSGASARAIDRAAQMGAGLAARRYSKTFELEADVIGTQIALLAGFDPVLGAAFFDRLPDPGDRFLGTHPANADRKAIVAREAARLQGNAR
ncbi:MAG: M48 family metallopeptidase [Cypionkella sp.]|nr:M48 family metallopeptidase [Cypionkella sp.]